MGKHETKRTAVIKADVDIGIVPAVKWLGEMGAIPMYSCEGDEDSKPYISFLCIENSDLTRIVCVLSNYGDVEIDCYNGILRYCIRFQDKDYLDVFNADFCSGLS